MKNNTGLLEDNRSEKKKERDFLHEELNFGSGAEWLSRTEAKKSEDLYYKENQKSTSSCAGHTGTLMLAVNNYLETANEERRLSRAFFYRKRVNYPNEGMYGYDVGNIGVKFGTCRDELLPTPATERAINAVKITKKMEEDAKVFRALKYIFLNKPTIFQLKNIANSNKAIGISIFATTKEWSKEFPEMEDVNLERKNANIHHLVTVLPNSGYEYRGKKYVIIQDSAWFGGLNIRHISEDWVNSRVRYGLYFIDLPNPTPSKEKSISFRYNFYRHLKVGDRGADVVKLQEALKELGFFTYKDCTGYFGGISMKAVIDFQEYYANEVLKFFGLVKGTGYVGRTTINKLHKLMD